MKRERIERLTRLRQEIKAINRQIDGRSGRYAADVVTGSDSHFPYTKHHMTIEGVAPDRYDRLLRAKVRRLEEEVQKLEAWLDAVDDPEMRAILRYRFSIGYTYEEIGEMMNYDKSTIQRKVERFFDNSTDATAGNDII